MFDNAFKHLARSVDRNGKAYAHAAAGARINGCIDAQQIALHIHQCAAGISRVDGGIGLNEIFEGIDTQLIAAQRRHNTAGDSLSDPKRIADSQHNVTHLQLVGIAQDHDGQFIQFDFQYSQIGIRVGSHQFGLGATTIVQDDSDFVC